MKLSCSKIVMIFTVAVLLVLLTGGTALAQGWPAAGSQGDQYGELNALAAQIAAEEGISFATFVAIYNAACTGQLFADNNDSGYHGLAVASPLVAIYAALSGPAAGRFTQEEIDATCRVLARLISFKSKLPCYDTVVKNLSCGARPVAKAAPPVRGKVPSTGLAVALLVGSAIVGVGAGVKMLKKNR